MLVQNIALFLVFAPVDRALKFGIPALIVFQKRGQLRADFGRFRDKPIQIPILSTSSMLTSSPWRSYSPVVRAGSCAAICCATSMRPPSSTGSMMAIRGTLSRSAIRIARSPRLQSRIYRPPLRPGNSITGAPPESLLLFGGSLAFFGFPVEPSVFQFLTRHSRNQTGPESKSWSFCQSASKASRPRGGPKPGRNLLRPSCILKGKANGQRK
jgi:hypothetical protein